MLEVLNSLLGRGKPSSKEVAKERLRLVLVHDRAAMEPQVLEALKEDLVQLISKYMEIDEDGIEVSLDQVEESVALVASIPIKQVNRRSPVR